jgi:adenylate kinase family enzyme
MTRVTIIGNAGGGKSTVARRLGRLLGLPLHAIDQLQWRPGWKPTPNEVFVKAHAGWLAEPRWIIDGWGDFESIEERFRASDTIILIDYPLWRHYWWAIKRQVRCLFGPRVDGPTGCPMLPMTWPLLKMIWKIDRHAMPKLRQRVEAHRGDKTIFHLRTLADLRTFCRLAERQAKTA